MASLDYAKFKPLNDRILLRRLNTPDDYSIIVRPEVAREVPVKCEVVATGPGRKIEGVNGDTVRQPCDVKPGDVVWIGPYFDLEEDGLVLVQEDDIRVKLIATQR